jgi:hypothetical protein
VRPATLTVCTVPSVLMATDMPGMFTLFSGVVKTPLMGGQFCTALRYWSVTIPAMLGSVDP